MRRNPYSSIAIAGNGAIATGLAALSSRESEVWLLTRSEASAERAVATLKKTC